MIKPERRYAARIGIALSAAGLTFGMLTQSAAAQPAWLTVSTLSADGSSAQQPDVAVDGAGNLLAAWTSSAGVQAADRGVGEDWVGSTIESGVAAEGVQLAMDEAGNALAVWQTSSTSRIRASYRKQGGQWSIPQTISNPEVPSFEPKAAMDAEGNATAVWYSHEDAHYRIRAADRSAGGAWTTPVALSPAGHSAQSPDVVVSTGMDVIAWSGHDGSHYRIQAVERSGSENWSAPAFVSAAGADSRTPQITRGTATYNPRIAWIREDADRRVQLSSWASSGWGAPNYMSPTGQDAYQPQLTSGGSSTSLVWRSSDGTDQRVRAQLYGNQGWEGGIRTVSPAGVDVSEVRVAVAQTGGSTIVWAGFDHAAEKYVVQADRVSPYYGQIPPPPQPKTDVASASASNLVLAADAQGDAVAAWQRDGEIKSSILDSVGPVSTVSAPSATRQTDKSFDVTRTADDRWSDVAQIVTKVRQAPWNGGFGQPGTWYWTSPTNTDTFPGQPGNTYCFTAQANDSHNNWGLTSAERCTATPMDDRTITANSSWYRGTSSSFYEGTFTRARTAGAFVTRNSIQARHLALLVTKCATCGKVRAYWNGTLLGTFNLAATSTLHKQLVTLKTFAGVETGTLKIVTDSAKVVYIDGLVARRT